MAILQKEERWVESPIPNVMWKNIKKLKKFPWLTKAIQIRVYKDWEWIAWKLYKFVFSSDVRQDFIDYFNDLYQKERDEYEKSWVKFIGDAIQKEKKKTQKDRINETTK